MSLLAIEEVLHSWEWLMSYNVYTDESRDTIWIATTVNKKGSEIDPISKGKKAIHTTSWPAVS